MLETQQETQKIRRTTLIVLTIFTTLFLNEMHQIILMLPGRSLLLKGRLTIFRNDG